jgi:hypothetical protein
MRDDLRETLKYQDSIMMKITMMNLLMKKKRILKMRRQQTHEE